MLADSNGVPIDRRGAPADDKTFQSWGLWEGAVWSEESEGTNGIGTCIVEQRTLTIHRDQHFYARNMLLSCTTAPIFDHEGKLLAVLDVSSCRADLVEGFLHLISLAASDAARRIEAEHFRASFPQARIMLVPAPDRHAAALVAVDGDDLVVGANRPARQLLGITQASLDKGMLAGMLIKGKTGSASAFAEAERGVLHRALVEADGKLSAAAKALGISRTTLYRKRKKMSLERPER
jgi:transcriptional regulator of acetoin/glycerol metabolism